MPRPVTSCEEKTLNKSKIVKTSKSSVKAVDSTNSCPTTPVVKKVKVKKVKAPVKEGGVSAVKKSVSNREIEKPIVDVKQELANQTLREDDISSLENSSNTDSEQRDFVEEVEELNELNEVELNEEDENLDESYSNPSKRKKAKKLQKEDFIPKWEYLFDKYAPELKNARKQPHQNVSLLKYLTTLKNETYKFMKLRKRKQDTGKTSGFMKEVKISDELEAFIGKGVSNEPITRVFITQRLCNYIKQMDLQNPNDKRTIIPDEKLKKLFDIKDNDKEKLTYYSMQQKIQRHIYKL